MAMRLHRYSLQPRVLHDRLQHRLLLQGRLLLLQPGCRQPQHNGCYRRSSGADSCLRHVITLWSRFLRKRLLRGWH